MPNLKSIVIISLSFLIFIIFFHPINALQQDLGRHLLLGEIIVQTQDIPKTNLLSYTNPNYPFINTHWLSEVIFYLVHNMTGFLGLLILTTLIAVAAFLIQLLYVKRQHIIPIIIVSLLYSRILLERTDLRPEIFSFFFLSVFIVILYKYRTGFTKWIYVLPVIELIWVNTHIYFLLGVGVLGLFLIDHLIVHRKNLKNKYTATLFVTLFVSVIATLVNPNIIQGALYPVHIFQNYGFEIEENHNVFDIWNLSQKKSTILYYFICIPLLFSVLFITIKKTKPVDWLLTVFFTLFAAIVERNLPLFVFATFIPFTKSLDFLYIDLLAGIKKSPNRRSVTYLFAVVVGLFTIWQVKELVTVNSFSYELPTGASKSVDYLQKNTISGPIFNNFDIGSYLAYRLYPRERVFVDGRPEAYPSTFFQQEYIPMQQDKAKFEKADAKYHFNAIFFSHTDHTPWTQQLLRDLNANTHWRLVYLDSFIVIYIKNNLQNHLIKDTSILNSTRLGNAQLSKDELINLHLFYENIGWTTEIKLVDRKLLELDPNSCFALRSLAVLLNNEQNPAFESYAIKYQSICQ